MAATLPSVASPVSGPLSMSRMPVTAEEWVVWGAVALACAWVLWKSVVWTFRPGEEADDHVKRSILEAEDAAFRAPGGAASGASRPAGTPPPPMVSSGSPR